LPLFPFLGRADLLGSVRPRVFLLGDLLERLGSGGDVAGGLIAGMRGCEALGRGLV